MTTEAQAPTAELQPLPPPAEAHPTVIEAVVQIEEPWHVPPAMPDGGSPDEPPVGLLAKAKAALGKVGKSLQGVKTLLVAAFFLAVSGVSYFDPDTLPLDSILGVFLPENKVAGAVGAVTFAFTILRLVSPGLLSGLTALSGKKGE